MEKPTLGRNESMKKKIEYTDESMGETRVVKDFLPPPEKLVLKESNVKITISLSKASVDFFKKEAKKHSTSYQKMIRRVIDVYTEKYKKTA
jgi:predicted DNA binding CopG/RHH family protein